MTAFDSPSAFTLRTLTYQTLVIIRGIYALGGLSYKSLSITSDRMDCLTGMFVSCSSAPDLCILIVRLRNVTPGMYTHAADFSTD